MIAAVAAPIGLLIGSFLNVVAYRLPRGESLLWPASHCPSCEAPIKPYDNVPVLSWLLLRGKCRGCGERISPRYPATELLTALAFAAIVLVKGVDKQLLWELPFAAMLIAVAAIDLEHRIVPNKILLPAAVFGAGAAALLRADHLPSLAIAAAGAFVFFLLAALAYPAGMGMGDVKLAGVMGLFLGLSVVPALFVAFVSGTVVGIVVIAREGAGGRKKGVPFAPFLAFGGIVGLLAGPALVHLYSATFL
ncbi:MAG: leader peptidase (prepilin peptidase) / N-methyltransferase [Thermoleophilaceae bacterium]|jgi:leader peptidase (prepilin peptidase)/N-methyltransferase|nr:leader peptidase (prepilin peptidase) / N-methyltransferase [Thermoleophilaceae bacterium]